MKNGLYALASLDGRPLATRDLAVMGLDRGTPLAAPGCVLAPHDVRPAAIHARSDDAQIDVLLGHLDEPAEAARRLGLPADTDDLTLALEMVRRFDDDAVAHLPGGWLLAGWDAAAATLTLRMADQVRDTCYVVSDGTRLAVAPELARLARLDWVDAAPDPVNLMISVGRARLRNTLGDRTMLRDVRRVMAGSRVVVRRHDVRVAPSRPITAPTATHTISFEEAIDQFDRLLRRIVRQLFDREGNAALALSGGLDSSLLALYMAEERGDAALTFLTSAAPPGSRLSDESGFAAITAAHLGVRLEKVSPGPEATIYRPSDRTFQQHEAPLALVRHYLDEALAQAALDAGAHTLLYGTGGEMTVTNYGDFLPPDRSLRNAARAVRNRLRGPQPAETWPAAGFHVRPSAAALDRLPDALGEIWEEARIIPRMLRPDDMLGFETSALQAGEWPSWGIASELRGHTPLYDRRLLLYGATIPAGLVSYRGRKRAMAREMMRDRLPDSIVRHGAKLPYSPTYYQMIAEHAEMARGRIPLFRAEGIDQWIDLDWLDRALSNAASSPKQDMAFAFELQQTAMFAEYMIWWNRATT